MAKLPGMDPHQDAVKRQEKQASERISKIMAEQVRRGEWRNSLDISGGQLLFGCLAIVAVIAFVVWQVVS